MSPAEHALFAAVFAGIFGGLGAWLWLPRRPDLALAVAGVIALSLLSLGHAIMSLGAKP